MDDVADFDEQGKHQSELFQLSINCLVSFKDTPYEDFARKMLLRCTENDYQYWSEEVLADYQGYLYCASTEEYSPKEQYLGMAIAFTAMRILEYLDMEIVGNENNPAFYLPVFCRDFFLAYIVCNRNFKDKMWPAFLVGEWGVFTMFQMLFEQAMEEYRIKNND